ncbi:hypothetical protein PSEHALCIP103_03572 [Pseudoalteromonas haloplanktis]|jgi:hypothetical protein|uniref:Uncharacterized protein n=1 Tax=Pseudoalteromonas haloplanktis TaxID=228 RepID=A0A9W4R457_PSEHA|nr:MULTISPECIES: hypothetical protein [Pseudoalteromonas]TMO21305.1 hypothetical protein CWC30_14945 [Pseudoalteromonas sp. S4741]CAH9066368.1 hypothetical protein PSEHALCIP103_03572 [Pseudoalteromonas haloplanktis]
MDQIKNQVVAVILGVALAYASIAIAGIGAAVAIPADILKPVAQISGLLAFTLVDLFTIAVPLAAAFLVVAFASKLVIRQPDFTFYVLLLAPLVLLQLYFVAQSQPQVLNNIITTLPRYLLLAVCFYFLVRSSKRANA